MPSRSRSETQPTRFWGKVPGGGHFLPIVLASLCAGLCVVVLIQWVRESRLRRTAQELGAALQSKSETAAKSESALKQSQQELQRLETLKDELRLAVKTNLMTLSVVSRQLQAVTNDLGAWQKQSVVYKDGLTKANDTVYRQNEDLRRQNEEIKKAVALRDEAISRYNKLAAEHNELVRRWNRQQEDLARAAAASGYR